MVPDHKAYQYSVCVDGQRYVTVKGFDYATTDDPAEATICDNLTAATNVADSITKAYERLGLSCVTQVVIRSVCTYISQWESTETVVLHDAEQ